MSSFLLDVQIECKSPAAPLSLALHLPCFLCPEAVESGPAASAHVVVAFFHAPNNNPFNPPTPRTFSAVATPATAVTRTSAVPARDPSNLISDEDPVGGCCPTPPLAEEETTAAVKLKAKKSFNSNASLPDSAGNYSDEFGSTSLSSTRIPPPSRALYVIACDLDDVDQHPPIPPPRRPIQAAAAATSESSTELSETEKEITVQYLPWPGAEELIPAHQVSFFQCAASTRRKRRFASSAAQRSRRRGTNQQMTDRVLLRHLKQESKSVRRFRHVRPLGDGARNVGQLRAAVSTGRRTRQSAAAGGCVDQQRQAGQLGRQFRRFPHGHVGPLDDDRIDGIL